MDSPRRLALNGDLTSEEKAEWVLLHAYVLEHEASLPCQIEFPAAMWADETVPRLIKPRGLSGF